VRFRHVATDKNLILSLSQYVVIKTIRIMAVIHTLKQVCLDRYWCEFLEMAEKTGVLRPLLVRVSRNGRKKGGKYHIDSLRFYNYHFLYAKTAPLKELTGSGLTFHILSNVRPDPMLRCQM
jgi:hypothetical protein